MSGLLMAGLRQARIGHTAAITLVLASCLASAAFAATKEYRYTVGPHANISVDTQYGAISVKPGSDNQVVVTATFQSDNVEVDQQQSGNRIEIASHLLRGTDQQTGQVDYELLIPPDATVNLRSSTGPLTAERLHGDLTLEGAEAVVNVRNVENGHVHVRTMRGPITLIDVRNGHVEIASISGDVHLKSVTGPLVLASSGSGRIFYDGDFGSGGDFRFVTHSGDIEVLVPADVSAGFRAHSMLGRVQHDFPLKPRHSQFSEEVGRSFVGNAGQASSEVVLRSFSGRIRLKQR
jgi:FlaG/FlaF family flagellin (archaellin)